jgi:hypothetical protein
MQFNTAAIVSEGAVAEQRIVVVEKVLTKHIAALTKA